MFTMLDGGKLSMCSIDIRLDNLFKFIYKMAFSRPSNSRQLSFEEIASKTKLPLNEVLLF